MNAILNYKLRILKNKGHNEIALTDILLKLYTLKKFVYR